MTKRDFKADVLHALYHAGIGLLIASAAAALLAISGETIGGQLLGDIPKPEEPKPEAPRCYCCEG